MIAKHIPINAVKKSSFAGLVNYIMGAQQQPERIGTIRATHCHSDRVDAVIAEVLNTQQMNKRAVSDKTYHLVISFRSEDQPTDEVLAAIENRLCDGLGFNEHQRISVVHNDTDHLHIHVAINKIHPTRLTIHNPHYDYQVIGELCEKLEQEYGLTPDNHEAKQRGAQSPVSDIEFKAGETSLVGWIKQECLDQIKAANNWADLHQVLKEHSLELRERGNGFVLFSSNGIAVKASSVDRSLSKKQLTERLGTFVPAGTGQATSRSQRKEYQKRPIQGKINTTTLYAKYIDEQNEAFVQRTDQWNSARKKKNRAIESAKRQAKLKRVVIKNLQSGGLSKKIMRCAVHQTLFKQIQRINQEFRNEYQIIKANNQRMAWLDWLSLEARGGNSDALEALRSRVPRSSSGNLISGNKRQEHSIDADAVETFTKNETAIYRIGSATIRDDGTKIIVPGKTSQDALHDVLQFAVQKYGNQLAINGTKAFREQIVEAAVAAGLSITFDDKNLEQRRQALIKQKIRKNLDSGKLKTKQKGRSR
ncbi:MAG: relaxase/mobilization nuclease domain-containing protein [Nitrosomonas sp.]|nr:relaxase/mobilization nuclease domain-containing protein [Nitrosomonas sp.]